MFCNIVEYYKIFFYQYRLLLKKNLSLVLLVPGPDIFIKVFVHCIMC